MLAIIEELAVVIIVGTVTLVHLSASAVVFRYALVTTITDLLSIFRLE